MSYSIKLKRKQELAFGTFAFYFDKPEWFAFRAWQFADWTLIDPPETDTQGDTRGLSFITAPYEQEIWFATRLRDSVFKKVLRDLPLGAQLTLDGPYGDFRLHNDTTKSAVFIIGGIGITPVFSMIKQALHDQTDHKIILFYANKTPHDAPFEKELKELDQKYRNLTLIQIFSKTSEGENVEHGHMNSDILKKHIEDISSPIYYLAWPQGMVIAMRTMLTDISINEDNIKTEEFSGY